MFKIMRKKYGENHFAWSLFTTRPLMIFLIFSFVIIATNTVNSVNAAENSAPISIGDLAPEFPADGEWIAGGAQKINDFGTQKLLLLYFGKAGCPSCDSFAPHLYRLLRKNEADLRVVMITPGIFPREEVETYAAERKLGDYPIMRDAGKNYLAKFIGKIMLFPYAALIDHDGKLIWFGRAKFHEQITAEIDRALGRNLPPKLPAPAVGEAVIIGSAITPTLPESLGSTVSDAEKVAAALQSRGYRTTVLTGKVAKDDAIAAIKKAAGTVLSEEVATDDALAATEKTAETAVQNGQTLVYFSGDAMEVEDGRNVAFAFSDGDQSLADFVDAANGRGFFIIDAAQAGAFSGLNEAVNSDSRIFNDTIKHLDEAFPQASILLSTARGDVSLLLPDYSGTRFADALSAALIDGAETATELTRNVALRLADFSRGLGRGELQSPARFGIDCALLK